MLNVTELVDQGDVYVETVRTAPRLRSLPGVRGTRCWGGRYVAHTGDLLVGAKATRLI
jgi:hypothetical protein